MLRLARAAPWRQLPAISAAGGVMPPAAIVHQTAWRHLLWGASLPLGTTVALCESTHQVD